MCPRNSTASSAALVWDTLSSRGSLDEGPRPCEIKAREDLRTPFAWRSTPTTPRYSPLLVEPSVLVGVDPTIRLLTSWITQKETAGVAYRKVRPYSCTDELTATASSASVYKRRCCAAFVAGSMKTWLPRPGENRWETKGAVSRVHVKSRLGLLVPSRTKGQAMPVPEDQLSGEGVTFVRASGNVQRVREQLTSSMRKPLRVASRTDGQVRPIIGSSLSRSCFTANGPERGQ